MEGHEFGVDVEQAVGSLIGAMVLEAKKMIIKTSYQNPKDLAASQRRSISEASPALRRSKSTVQSPISKYVFTPSPKLTYGFMCKSVHVQSGSIFRPVLPHLDDK